MASKRETWDGSAPTRRKAIRLIRDEIEAADLAPQDLARLATALAGLEHSARQARRLRLDIEAHGELRAKVAAQDELIAELQQRLEVRDAAAKP